MAYVVLAQSSVDICLIISSFQYLFNYYDIMRAFPICLDSWVFVG